MRIAANVRRLRAERGLTQERLAERAELSTVGVAFIEGARTNVTTATLCQLAHALEVDIAVLVSPHVVGERAVARPPDATAAEAERPPQPLTKRRSKSITGGR